MKHHCIGQGADAIYFTVETDGTSIMIVDAIDQLLRDKTSVVYNREARELREEWDRNRKILQEPRKPQHEQRTEWLRSLQKKRW